MTGSGDRRSGGCTGVLFVCLGNICRSPLAEGIFTALTAERRLSDRFEIDSCGTGGWHVGERPDPRMLQVAARHGLRLTSRARRLDPQRDFERFDLILPMDRENLETLQLAGAPMQRVRLMRSFDPSLRDADESMLDVPDPYFGSGDGFERVYQMLRRACEGLLDELTQGG